MIELKEVVYDVRARDGTWCKLPYPGHPKGCPNFPKCPNTRVDFCTLISCGLKRWFAVVEEFDLKAHAEEMKRRHPDWSERQCRNLLYWQGPVRLLLTAKAYEHWVPGGIVLEIPEAHGINVFETMAKVGIVIERHPDIVRKVMLVGKRKE